MANLNANRAVEPVSEYVYHDFIYSVTLKKVSSEAKTFTLLFGASQNLERHQLLTVDFDEGKISFGDQDQEIKSVKQEFVSDRDYKITLVVNDNVAKVYLDGDDVASLVYSLSDYIGGRVASNLEDSHFEYSNTSLTSLNTNSGDFNCLGYNVLRVVNLGDGNYCLQSDEYDVTDGVVTIDRDYLKTLETNSEYKFRAITDLTDFDFYVSTPSVGVQVMSSVEKYYRGDDLRFEFSENTTVSKMCIDNEEFLFTLSESVLTVDKDVAAQLVSGKHTAKFFTSNGRPEAQFSLYESVEIIPEIPAKPNHTFFFIDIGIFAVLILGYVLFSKIGKRS